MENFLDYYSAQIFFANNDWPQNNIDFWRVRKGYDPQSPPGHDGRFRWMLYDVDISFGYITNSQTNMYSHISDKSHWRSELFLNFLQNQTFKSDFINRQADLMNSTFLPHRTIHIIDSIAALIEPEIAEHITRWNMPKSKNDWLDNIDTMRTFALKRASCLQQHIIKYFKLDGCFQINLSTDYRRGKIKLNSLLIDRNLPGVQGEPYPWNGTYFKGVPVTLEPIAQNGFLFSHWRVNGKEDQSIVLEIEAYDDIDIEAVFVKTDKPYRKNETIVHYFHFNNSEIISDSTQRNNLIFSDYSFSSNASVSYSGTGYFDITDGTSLNSQFEHRPGSALKVRNSSDTNSLILSVPTTEFKQIHLSYAVCRTTNGAASQSVYYSTSPGHPQWTLLKTDNTVTTEYKLQSFDFSSIPQVNNNPDFMIRITFDELSGESSANNCFDNIVLEGDLINNDNNEHIKDSLSLQQNVPNPFRHSTQIPFSLSSQCFVMLNIYDMKGCIVASLVNKTLPPGNHKVFWNPLHTVSGLYFYRLVTSDGKVRVRKMILNRG